LHRTNGGRMESSGLVKCVRDPIVSDEDLQ
jgi:hypothetical protein